MLTWSSGGNTNERGKDTSFNRCYWEDGTYLSGEITLNCIRAYIGNKKYKNKRKISTIKW